MLPTIAPGASHLLSMGSLDAGLLMMVCLASGVQHVLAVDLIGPSINLAAASPDVDMVLIRVPVRNALSASVNVIKANVLLDT